MMKPYRKQETGSTLIVALGTILVVSLIGAGVLMNCTRRYNAASKQVKAWKEALYAAEAGGDIGYAECRKFVTGKTEMFSTAHGWTKLTGTAKDTWTKSLPGFGEGGSLTSDIRVDQVDDINGNPYYRVRATGYARVFGIRGVGMDDTLTGVAAGNRFASNAIARGSGDSLLRKIDFNYDHFIATYGDGDGTGKQLVSVPTDASGNRLARVARRIELIVVPVMSFDAALKATTSFSGPGSAGQVDSYHSQNGAYPGTSVATNSAHQFYADARNGNISVGGPTFGQGGYIYG
ncbi:MAG TPA: hypothetical protein VG095_00435, partial [Chthoniobacterales bacterium]|nr:hypothetical protein [Chthoniobacterales bacterium]